MLGCCLKRFTCVQEYVYVEKPKGRLREKMDVAVDCMCRLSLGVLLSPDMSFVTCCECSA